MPCNSDYMEPNAYEKNMSMVMCLLDELAGKSDPHRGINGYHSEVYGTSNVHDKKWRDTKVAELCSACHSVNVIDYSLELQMWWRDHQKADQKRIEQEKQDAKNEAARKKALNKLTKEDREALGL